jgi:hypothetical protein
VPRERARGEPPEGPHDLWKIRGPPVDGNRICTHFRASAPSVGSMLTDGPRAAPLDDEMMIIFHSVVYAVILLVSAFYSLTAKADVGPPYSSNGASVFVPFVNATQVSDPSQYVSPQIKVGFNSPNATDTYPVFNVTMDTGSVGIIVGSSYFNPPANGRLDPSFIGPGSETLTSSGIIFSGDWYKPS